MLQERLQLRIRALHGDSHCSLRVKGTIIPFGSAGLLKQKITPCLCASRALSDTPMDRVTRRALEACVAHDKDAWSLGMAVSASVRPGGLVMCVPRHESMSSCCSNGTKLCWRPAHKQVAPVPWLNNVTAELMPTWTGNKLLRRGQLSVTAGTTASYVTGVFNTILIGLSTGPASPQEAHGGQPDAIHVRFIGISQTASSATATCNTIVREISVSGQRAKRSDRCWIKLTQARASQAGTWRSQKDSAACKGSHISSLT